MWWFETAISASIERRIRRRAMSAAPLRAGAARVTDVSWRVDVTLSTSSAHKVLRPSVVLALRLDDGTTETFECALDRVHALREAVATLLNEMDWAGREVEGVREIGARAQAGFAKIRATIDDGAAASTR